MKNKVRLWAVKQEKNHFVKNRMQLTEFCPKKIRAQKPYDLV